MADRKYSKELAEQYRALRNHNLSRNECAKRLGVSQPSLVRWEKKYPEMREAFNSNAIWPTKKYKPGHCQEALEFMAKGKTKTELAAHLKISERRMRDWRDKYPDFHDALETGETLFKAFMERQGIDAIHSDEPFNTAVWRGFMDNHCDWVSNRNKSELTGKDGGPIKFEDMPDATLDKHIEDLQRVIASED